MSTISISVTVTRTGAFFAPAHREVSATFGEVFKRRGYIVICTRPGPGYAIGDKIDNIWGYPTRRKFVVTEFTGKEDCERQLRLITKLRKDWTRRSLQYPAGTIFYRVVPWSREISQQLRRTNGRTIPSTPTQRRRLKQS